MLASPYLPMALNPAFWQAASSFGLTPKTVMALSSASRNSRSSRG